MFSVILLAALCSLGSAQRFKEERQPDYPRYPEITNCPEQYGLQTYPHPDSCHSFFKCANGTLTAETCENGLLYDGSTPHVDNHCNYHWAVNCEGRLSDLIPINNGICEFAFGIYPTGTCDPGYVKCKYGEPTDVPCPSGLAYDERTHTCNWGDLNEYCNPEDLVGFRCPDYIDPSDLASKFIPFPRFKDPQARDCESYIVCVNDLPRRVFCGDYTLFDSTTLACADPDVARC